MKMAKKVVFQKEKVSFMGENWRNEICEVTELRSYGTYRENDRNVASLRTIMNRNYLPSGLSENHDVRPSWLHTSLKGLIGKKYFS